MRALWLWVLLGTAPALGQEDTRLQQRYDLKEPAAPPSAAAAPQGSGMFALPGLGGGPPQRLKYQYSWGGEAEVISRRQNDLNGEVRDNFTSVKPQLNGIFIWRPTDWMESTLELLLERELSQHEEVSVRLPNGTVQERPVRPPSLLVEQLFVALRPPGSRFSLALGRRNFEDDRHWLYDTSMDTASLTFRAQTFRAEFSLGREAWRQLEMLPKHHQQTDAVDTYMLYTEYRGIRDTRLAVYQVTRDDRTPIVHEGRTRMMGLRLQGAPTVALSYWGEAARMYGQDDQRHRMVGRAFDIGFTYRMPWLPLSPNVTLGYAAATGDGNPNDGENHEFRQTGLQSNEHRYGGVALFNIYGEVLAPELSNLKVTSYGIGFRPSQMTSLDFIYHYYRLHEIADENRNWLLTGLMNQVPGRESRDVGQAIDVVFGMRNILGVRRLGLDLRMGWFSPGQAFLRNEGTRARPRFVEGSPAMTVVAKFFF